MDIGDIQQLNYAYIFQLLVYLANLYKTAKEKVWKQNVGYGQPAYNYDLLFQLW